MKFPNTLDFNSFRAYFCPAHLSRDENRQVDAINLDWDSCNPESLKILCLKAIAHNWLSIPFFREIPLCEDRHFLLDLLDIEFPLDILCSRIRSNAFWKRAFVSRWKNYYPVDINGKPWIRVYLEKHVSETLEQMNPADYAQESVEPIVNLCSLHVKELKICQLQPPIGDNNDHIPLDLVLSNLRELRKVDITYDVKNAGHNFYLGCASITDKDVKLMARGLERCYELTEFRLHSTKLEPAMMKRLAAAMDKGCPNLTTIAFPHCRCGDVGIRAFFEALSQESLPKAKEVILTNNFLSSESILDLIHLIRRRPIERLDLRLNPILTEGAIFVLTMVFYLPLKELNLSCCSIDEEIEEYLLMILRFNKSIKFLDFSSNKLGLMMGERLAERVRENKTLQKFDLRNTDISAEIRAVIDEIVMENRDPHCLSNW
ncbi:uncharacterized protein LOC129776763 [Toxorhynchites rutilus septentrionalis]|uniref:uncharacterized protein LOC129776763 n=1 Tax=Toxorhynchites rutilus septentrionalis TaxID=329112 RepID=UPI00247891EC|nr:uncharacterized protein LOC129776763 [Toxorhynchites rutilus septentrionalis]XP_055638573.1 uncharacterized protein LOC129776763 [Toxorhynchites rutilus septentrionalis]